MPYSAERIKGNAFEKLCLAFLKHDPLQRTLYKDPVPYGEWAPLHGLPARDVGVDLVAKVRNGPGWCAIQCKFWDKGKTITKDAVASLIAGSGSNHFTCRLFIDATEKEWSRLAQQIARNQTIPVVRIGMHDLRNSPIDWEMYFQSAQIEPKPPKTPRSDQEEAIRNVLSGLKERGTRGKLLMACGTGKTFTALRIAEDLVGAGGRVLYLVPSLALMSQTVKAWTEDQRYSLRAYAVCSDSQVGRRTRRNDDLIDMDTQDLAFPATTSPSKLATEAGPNDPDQLTVVFATYHSLPVIAQAQKEHTLPDFDLAICDEAHRTAGARISGEKDSHFVQIHDQANVRTDRRLYMTATPKVYAASARTKAGKVNAELCSMEDKALYGPVLYEIGFGSAVELKLLTDYKVIVLTISEQEVAKTLQQTLSKHKIELSDAGKLVGCWRALAKTDEDQFPEDDQLPMRRAIAYCRDIRTSKLVTEHFEQAAHEYRATQKSDVPNLDIASRHIDGTFSAKKRDDELTWLNNVKPEDRKCHVLSNARVLTEGVDVPALDAILFIHPRKSQIDVVQAVGRVMRRAEGKGLGYVILPVVVPAGMDTSESLGKSKAFQVVWQVLNAIRSHDERFEAMLNLIEAGQECKNLGIIALSGWDQKKPKPTHPDDIDVGKGDGKETDTEENDTDTDEKKTGTKKGTGGGQGILEWDIPCRHPSQNRRKVRQPALLVGVGR